MNTTFVQRVLRRCTRGFITAFHDIPAERMETLIDSLRPLEPVHLSEIVGRAKAGRSTAGLCAITVDDGMGQTVEAVSGLCKRRGWPVTFFLPTANLNSGGGMAYEWWREIEPLLHGRKLLLSSGTLDLTRKHAVASLSATLERLWHSAPQDLYFPFTMELVEAVARQLGVQVDSFRPPQPVSWSEVARLSKDDLFRFESHGVSHVAMSALPEGELILELRASRDTVSEHTGKPCRHLAYPFGSRQSIGTRAPILARRYYDSAVTMSQGSVDSADPWMLPRVPLYAKNSRAAARMKILLNCSSLIGHGAAPYPGTDVEVPVTNRTANSGPLRS